jgi:hypothetical protein
MGYVAFEVCTIDMNGNQKRGAKATCGQCGATHKERANSSQGVGDDDAQVERRVARRFQSAGWQIGKRPSLNRCPDCVAKMEQKMKELDVVKDSKVVQMTTTSVKALDAPDPFRPMTRDDRRIIHNKVDEVYVSEAVGYSAGWSDQRVSSDLGVPKMWVSKIRDESFGPDLDEAVTQTIKEAREVLEEMRAMGLTLQPIIKQLEDLSAKADRIETALMQITKE